MKEKNEKIIKSKEIIKKEKKKIKEEKRKQSKLNKFINKIFNKNKKEKEVFSLKEQIISMLFYEMIGFVICLLVLFALSGGKNYIKLYMDLNKLINVYDTIQTSYYGDFDKEEIVDSAISAMVDSVGDGFTTYSNEEDTETFLENLDGTYEGIGCMVSMNENNEIVVISIFENSPSEKAGLQVQDIILKIDNQDFAGKTSEDMANYVKENENDEIKLTIKREEEQLELTLIREKVEVPSVTSKIIEQEDKKIGYIDISIFSSVTYEQFKKNLEKLEKENIAGLIIDVRNDTGGYLDSVTDITSLFLEKGKVIYQLQDENSTEKIKDKTKEHREYPVAVLINTASASASEILASAIKESYTNGLVIGVNSYGKGTVQKTKTLPDGSMIKYTIQKWLTPDGNWINEIGVEPTTKIAIDLEGNVDNQLNTAIEEIISKTNN